MSGVEVSSVPEVYQPSKSEDSWLVNVVLMVPATSSVEALCAVADTIGRGNQ